MASYKVEAVVLRAKPFAEADRLLTFLTAKGTKTRAVAKGTSRSRSRLAAAVQPFVHGRYLLWSGRTLDGVSQAEVIAGRHLLREDALRLGGASYVAELADAFTGEGDSNREVFVATQAALAAMAADGPLERAGRDRILRAAEAALLAAAGYRPNVERCAVCGGTLGESGATFVAQHGGVVCARCRDASPGEPLGGEALAALRRLMAQDAMEHVDRLRLSERANRELEAALQHFIVWILQRPLKSLAFLDML